MSPRPEIYISVDVEASGPIPGEFSMLSVGACLVTDDQRSFSCLLQPLHEGADPKALEVTGLSLAELRRTGQEPETAMRSFADWIADIAAGGDPVFVGFNAPFDWSFVNYYFHRFLGSNPFGFTALDIKAYYMGLTGGSWADTRSSRIADQLRPQLQGDHEALADARYQAELFRLMLR
jgi:DNA polymerase III epsilon subunit-like protein